MMRWFAQQYCRHLAMGIVYMLHSSFFAIPTYAQELQWKVFGHLQEARVGFGIAAMGRGKVLVMGGFTKQNGLQNHRMKGVVTRSCEFIDVPTRSMTSAPPMYLPHAHAVILQTKDSNIVVVSGLASDTATTPICEMYDRRKNEWRILGALLLGRFNHAAAFINDEEILIAGGRPNFGYAPPIAEAEIFNTRTGQSRRINDFPCPNSEGYSAQSYFLAPGVPIFIGGRGAGGEGRYQITDVYSYNASSGHWFQLTSLPFCAHSMSAIRLIDGRLMVSSGEYLRTREPGETNPTQGIAIEAKEGIAIVGTKIQPLLEGGVGQWSGDIVLFFGGCTKKRANKADSEWFDLKTQVSIVGPPLQSARGLFHSISFPLFDEQGNQKSSCILAISGLDSENRLLTSVEILETTNPQLIEVPNPEIASQRLKKLLTSPTVVAILAGFILILIAGLLYLLYQVLIIRRQSKFSYQSNAVRGQK